MIREYFNEKAGTWDSNSSEKDQGKLQSMAERLDLKPGSKVLDTGTGTGVFLPYLLKMVGATGHIIALDIAEKMLLQAKVKDFKGNIDFICARAENIPLKTGICDAVVCYSSFPHFHDKPKALQEIKRTLKTGGSIFVCHTSGISTINRIHMSVPLLHHDTLLGADGMKQLLETAGFKRVRVEDSADSYLARGQK